MKSIEEINKLKPVEVLEDETTKSNFVRMVQNINPELENIEAVAIYEREKYYFTKILNATPELKNCTGLSIYGCFLDIASMGLSLENTGNPSLYITSRSFETSKGSGIWLKQASIIVSPYGELILRIEAGQVLYIDNPVIVYEGDEFRPYVKSGVKSVDYSPKIPRESKKIIASFVAITRPDKSKDFFWMLEDDILRLKGYSAKQNKKTDPKTKEVTYTANKLYSSDNGGIDRGFLEAKTIKHAFDSFPKVRIGQFSKLSSEEPQAMDYGLSEPQVYPEPEEQTSFDDEEQPPYEKGMIIQDNDDMF
jgi:hypothetical protein